MCHVAKMGCVNIGEKLGEKHMSRAMNHTPTKIDSLEYIPVADSMGITATTLTQLSPKVTKFSKITQNNGHYTVQSRSGSPLPVPEKSVCEMCE